MTGKCEICGNTAEPTRVSSCACDESFPHAFLCEDCKKKYFDYMASGPSGSGTFLNFIPSVPYFHNWSYAENLVYAYKVRFKHVREPHKEYTGPDGAEKKEAPTMKVEYNGFTGELVKLERTFNGATEIPVDLLGNPYHKWFYTLSVYDAEKKVTHSFDGVKLEDIKFLGGAVSFGQ